LRARNRRRHELRTILRDRKKIVDALLEVKRADGVATESTEAIQPAENEKRKPALKRYINE
jgi:putative transposase